MANLYFFTEARYLKMGNSIFNPSGVLKYDLFKRYLNIFNELIIVARVQIAKDDDIAFCTEENRVDGLNVSVYELPYFWGPIEYFKKKRAVSKIIQKIANNLNDKDRCILRVPGNIGDLTSKILKKKGINYYVEVVGDPFDVFSSGASNHRFRLIIKLLLYYSLKNTVKNANGVCYITEMVLPQRYPASKNAFVNIISNVKLKNSDFINEIIKFDNSKVNIELISIGSLEQMYKSPDVVIDAIAKLVTLNYSVHLTWIGEGKFKDSMVNYAQSKGVHNYVSFIGYVSNKQELNKLLDASDIFVLVSRAEAQGRAIIEAMARGKIVIGSNVGGIPENVSPEFLVPKNDVNALVNKILEVKALNNIDRWQIRNLAKAKEYEETILQVRRDIFLTKVLNDERKYL